jgi:hypothetical protein
MELGKERSQNKFPLWFFLNLNRLLSKLAPVSTICLDPGSYVIEHVGGDDPGSKKHSDSTIQTIIRTRSKYDTDYELISSFERDLIKKSLQLHFSFAFHSYI